MNDSLELIEQGCYLALRFMLKPLSTPTGCLDTTQGCYGFRERAATYHPLESVLIGEDVRSDDWKLDAAAKLGVSAAWVEGFLAGFAQANEASADPDYVQGYLAAEELRQRRPGWFRES